MLIKMGVLKLKYTDSKVSEIKIAYIGGGSRGWAWGFMSDLATSDDISGDVYLYDIDYEAAQHNEIIGNKYKDLKETKSIWNYHAVKGIDEALKGADFVIISILPATFDEMESDVHTPEKYGVYQPVGDTTGPGGIIRAMRTIPMYEYIAENIKEYCPEAWVINYTNPMTLCVKTLYRVFPKIKAFGCCHEVFGTQKLLMKVLEETKGIKVSDRSEIKVNPVAVNHFTWLTSAKYKNIDLFPLYREFCEKYAETGYGKNGNVDKNWMNNMFVSEEKVKMDLFLRYGLIAAAGDRHLAEFCNGEWYLKDPERVAEMHFSLTTVAFRKENLKERLENSRKMISGEKEVTVEGTGEEGVHQIRALLGLCELVTNVNIPNVGQIPNLPLGAVVETNAVFRDNSVTPVSAGDIPKEIYTLVSRIVGEQELAEEGIHERDLDKIFCAFISDPLLGKLSISDAKALFKEMIENTKEYLTMFDLKKLGIE